jgi:heme-degrading monooxygenase HmoA
MPHTHIDANARHVTEIGFWHCEPTDQAAVLDALRSHGARMTRQAGFVAVNLLRSLDGTRVCTYLQWRDSASLAHARKHSADRNDSVAALVTNAPLPREYEIVYADDRSAEGVSVISPAYTGAIFINEITTHAPTQRRLLELVIANNVKQSINLAGYRSANFHRSLDGQRAVNYSLWSAPEPCLAAISQMADMDENLEETIEIATPDFRFYELVFAAHCEASP